MTTIAAVSTPQARQRPDAQQLLNEFEIGASVITLAKRHQITRDDVRQALLGMGIERTLLYGDSGGIPKAVLDECVIGTCTRCWIRVCKLRGPFPRRWTLHTNGSVELPVKDCAGDTVLVCVACFLELKVQKLREVKTKLRQGQYND